MPKQSSGDDSRATKPMATIYLDWDGPQDKGRSPVTVDDWGLNLADGRRMAIRGPDRLGGSRRRPRDRRAGTGHRDPVAARK